ncbi:MAG: ATP-dependent zinc metalloprotease FtsH [Clostridiales bacterium]|jgi:cell division protease FtsH|nr:ATP-dependent zinc metalloprotease FtsH [Clostridiales bacterium]
MIMVLLVLAYAFSGMPQLTVPQEDKYIYSDLLRDLEDQKIEQLDITGDLNEISNTSGTVIVHFKEAGVLEKTIEIVDMSGFLEKAYAAYDAYGLKIEIRKPMPPSFLFQVLPYLVIGIVFIVAMYFVMQNLQGGGGRVMNFGKSRARLSMDERKKVNFASVAGLEEEKHELEELVDYLKYPKKFIEIGARIPKGVLLVGPPGTGKTLLAKAIAGEAGVPFFSISGSDFVEMFVGVGASRVRDLFEQAKRSSPSMVFIDEIDAVGRRRGAGLGGGHDEREQTLNQLLVEMDGFGVNESVIIIAATNRPDILDPALLRPGRFDRRVHVGRPDIKGREDILLVHARGKKIGKDVDFKVIAQTTAGFTGADLENLLNESALLAVRNGKKEVDMEELRKAFIKVGIGTEKKSKVITQKEKRETAYHEAGHAIITEMLDLMDPVHIVSVIPTGAAGGYTMHLPTEERMFSSKKYMEQEIVVLLGGRAAEELVIKDITTGASNDIERASNMARAMVTKYGMSDLLGPIQFGGESDEVFIGRDWGHTRNYGENVASQIDSEIKRIVDNSYKLALEILNDNMDVLHSATDLLMEKEKINGDEFRALFPEGKITKKSHDKEREESIRSFLDTADTAKDTADTAKDSGGIL